MPTSVGRFTLQQPGSLDLQRLGQRLKRVDRRRVFLALDHADIVAIEPGTIREFLLGKPSVLPQPPQILSYDPPKFHGPHGSPSRFIAPPSILGIREVTEVALTMTLPSPSDQSLSFALSPDGDGYLASFGQGEGAGSLVRLWLPRKLVDTAVFKAANLNIDLAADGTVMVYADCDGGQTIARASLEALIAAMLDVLDRNEDMPHLEALEAQLERSLGAIRRTRGLLGPS